MWRVRTNLLNCRWIGISPSGDGDRDIVLIGGARKSLCFGSGERERGEDDVDVLGVVSSSASEACARLPSTKDEEEEVERDIERELDSGMFVEEVCLFGGERAMGEKGVRGGWGSVVVSCASGVCLVGLVGHRWCCSEGESSDSLFSFLSSRLFAAGGSGAGRGLSC
jgi:hypothetical protein